MLGILTDVAFYGSMAVVTVVGLLLLGTALAFIVSLMAKPTPCDRDRDLVEPDSPMARPESDGDIPLTWRAR